MVLQSCTVSLAVVPGSCSETSVTSSNHVHEVISIKVEEDTVIKTQPKDIPEPNLTSLPAMKSEKDEVNYMSVSLVLDKEARCKCRERSVHAHLSSPEFRTKPSSEYKHCILQTCCLVENL